MTSETSALLSKYKEAKEAYKKTTFCYYYWRKCCYFTDKRCKFAHGIEDLKRCPREEFLAIRKAFFSLKGQIHGKPNPNGEDLNPKESRVDDLAFSSDEEEAKVFKTKRRSRSKEEHDKLRVWQHHILADFALFLFDEAKSPYLERKLMEGLFSDVKLKFDTILLAERMKVVYQKTAQLSPPSPVRTQIMLKYPVLEEIMDLLVQFLGKTAGTMLKKYKFPVQYQEFEKIYHESLPLALPELKILRELLKITTNLELINAIQSNKQIMERVRAEVGEENLTEGFLMNDHCNPLDKEKLVKKFENVMIADYATAKDLCCTICHETFKYFVSKDKAVEEVMSDIGFKLIMTNSGAYFIKSSEISKKFEVLNNEEIKCPYNHEIDQPHNEATSLKLEKLNDILIENKILWVNNLNTLQYSITITENVKEIGVDLEGGLDVILSLTNRKEELICAK